MKTMEPDEHEIYKFLGSEQAHGIQMKTMFERIIKEGSKHQTQ